MLHSFVFVFCSLVILLVNGAKQHNDEEVVKTSLKSALGLWLESAQPVEHLLVKPSTSLVVLLEVTPNNYQQLASSSSFIAKHLLKSSTILKLRSAEEQAMFLRQVAKELAGELKNDKAVHLVEGENPTLSYVQNQKRGGDHAKIILSQISNANDVEALFKELTQVTARANLVIVPTILASSPQEEEENARRALQTSSKSPTTSAAKNRKRAFRGSDYVIMFWTIVVLIVLVFFVFFCIVWSPPLDFQMMSTIRADDKNLKTD